MIETDLPSRLDRLPWGRFHSLIVVALGITWLLDGLEVTLAGAVASALKTSPTLHFSNTDVGLTGSAYIAGAVLGALGFGWLTDRLGRRKLFFITLTLYLAATAATALSWNLASFLLFRFLTGAGIGGEYTAINSTIQEFTPARVRGWTDLGDQRHVLGRRGDWRGRLAGAARSAPAADRLGLARVLLDRRGARARDPAACASGCPKARAGCSRMASATKRRRSSRASKRAFADAGHRLTDEPLEPPASAHARPHAARAKSSTRSSRCTGGARWSGLSLMTAQAFFYNAIFFTYALVLTDFYQRAGRSHRLVSAAVRARQFSRTARARDVSST